MNPPTHPAFTSMNDFIWKGLFDGLKRDPMSLENQA